MGVDDLGPGGVLLRHDSFGMIAQRRLAPPLVGLLVVCLMGAASASAQTLAGGAGHSVILKSDGTVWTTGLNGNGQLGDNTTTSRKTPIAVSGLSNIVAVAAGRFHTLALDSSGSVWAWGHNQYGHLGDATTTERKTPVLAGVSSVVGIAAGEYHSVAVRSNGKVYTFGRNSNGQLANGTTTSSCGCGSLDALVDGNGNRTRWERDVQGRVTREVRADGTTDTHYTYDGIGRRKTITDPKDQVTTHTYFRDDALANTVYTNAQIATPSVSYTYDPVYPRVATMVDGIGTTSYTYTAPGQLGAGQVASVDGPLTNDTITYAYDQLGRVTTRATNGVGVTWVFDTLGRVTSEANVLGTFTYGYDGVTSRLATVTYPNGQTSAYSYLPTNQDHRLQTIDHKYPGGATLSKVDYASDAVGNILTWRQQTDANPAVLSKYGYDPADQLTSAVKESTDATPVVLKRYAYGYDPAGNRTFEQIDDAITLATHDNLNRDPAGFLDGPNRSAYVRNSPIRLFDPDGRQAQALPIIVICSPAR